MATIDELEAGDGCLILNFGALQFLAPGHRAIGKSSTVQTAKRVSWQAL